MDTRTPAEIEDSLRRKAQVLKLKRRRYTFEEIGRMLDPPVSRQRVHQIYHEALEEIVAPELAALRQEYREVLDEALREAWRIYERDHLMVSHGKVVRIGVPDLDDDGNPVIREGQGAPLLDDGPKLSALGHIKALVESLRKLDGVDVPVKTEVDAGVELRVTVVGTDVGKMT